MVSSNEFEVEESEAIKGLFYSIQDFPDDLHLALHKASAINLPPGIFLPPANQFIPTDFNLLTDCANTPTTSNSDNI